MALCPNHCDHGWVKLPFPVLLHGVVTDRIPCDVCDGNGKLSCCDGPVGGRLDVTNAPAPPEPRQNVICPCGCMPAGMCKWPNCRSPWPEGSLDMAR